MRGAFDYQLANRRHQIWLLVVEPIDSLVSPEPRHLAARVALGQLGCLSNCLLLRNQPVELSQRLRVTNGSGRVLAITGARRN